MSSASLPVSPRLLTTRAACAYLSVSKATLFRAARRGELHPLRPARHFTRWQISDLDRWIDGAACGREVA